jgi:hypothetical protein
LSEQGKIATLATISHSTEKKDTPKKKIILKRSDGTVKKEEIYGKDVEK